MSAQRIRRWSSIVQMLYKCFVFTGILAVPASKQCHPVFIAYEMCSILSLLHEFFFIEIYSDQDK